MFSNSKSVYAPFLVIQPYQSETTWQIPPTIIVGSHHLHTINAVPDVDKLFKYALSFPPPSSFCFSFLPLFTSFLIYFFCSTEANKPIYKTFEPLLASVLQTYMSSHDVETKQVALSMLSQLSKFGVPNSSSFHRFVRKNQDRRKKKSRRNL